MENDKVKLQQVIRNLVLVSDELVNLSNTLKKLNKFIIDRENTIAIDKLTKAKEEVSKKEEVKEEVNAIEVNREDILKKYQATFVELTKASNNPTLAMGIVKASKDKDGWVRVHDAPTDVLESIVKELESELSKCK